MERQDGNFTKEHLGKRRADAFGLTDLPELMYTNDRPSMTSSASRCQTLEVRKPRVTLEATSLYHVLSAYEPIVGWCSPREDICKVLQASSTHTAQECQTKG